MVYVDNAYLTQSFIRDKACEALDDDEEGFHKILVDPLHYVLQKRREFYHILVFCHFKLADMNHGNITDILTYLVQKYKPERTYREIQDFILQEKLDGKTLQDLVNGKFKDFRDKIKVLSLLNGPCRTIHNVLKGKWRKLVKSNIGKSNEKGSASSRPNIESNVAGSPDDSDDEQSDPDSSRGRRSPNHIEMYEDDVTEDYPMPSFIFKSVCIYCRKNRLSQICLTLCSSIVHHMFSMVDGSYSHSDLGKK